MGNWLEELAAIPADAEHAADRHSLLAGSAPPDASVQLHAGVLSSVFSDRSRAIRLNAAIQDLAGLRGDVFSKAWAARSQGHVEHVGGDYAAASETYSRAAELFEASGADLEVGRTLTSGIQALIYRGEYDRAMFWVSRAEQIFHRHGDLLRLARLDSNAGNIFFRQDRPADALARYQRALEGFEVVGEPRDIAAALSNLAVASINLGLFSEALDYYRRARRHCDEHGLLNLAARADYNVAYLHYLRGDYAEGCRLYDLSRARCNATGDRYHAALCDLDEAEMYLELNLVQEGERMAANAAAGFAGLGMVYEQAKALVNLAVAGSQRRDYRFADRTLLQARRLFVAEKNPVWPALVDQLRAVLAFHEMRYDHAFRLSHAAWRALDSTMLSGRAAHCQILLSRLWLRVNQADRARATIREALERAGENISPSLRFHAALVEGEIHERQGRFEDALAAWELARLQVEDMRGRVDTEDLRISILKDKLAVYEGLVSLYLEGNARSGDARRSADTVNAFLAVQQAKSRSLADRLAPPMRSAGRPGSETGDDEELRRELNGIYRRIDIASVPGKDSQPGVGALRKKALELEDRLTGLTVHDRSAGPADLASLQSALREGELLLEYYEARGQFHVFLLTRSSLHSVRLGPAAPVHQALRLFQFQIGKFRWSRRSAPEDAARLEAVSHHLSELGRMLIRPVGERLQGFAHLIFAPHGALHGLPFAALGEAGGPLADRFTVSSAPSAAVFARTRSRNRQKSWNGGSSVVMAVSDALAPRIEEEAQIVGALLPGSRILTGNDATVRAFWDAAPGARIVHLAAHGIFRRDNPAFSSLQLADGPLSLMDLNDAGKAKSRLSMDLLTLSACNTGSSVAAGGDELLGLIRGFLLAGARSLLASLWEIDDDCTMEFMRVFYREVRAGASLGLASRTAMLEIRTQFPHPYYWAPFLVVGDPDPVGGF